MTNKEPARPSRDPNPPQVPAYLEEGYPSSVKGGTVIAADVHDHEEHARRLLDPATYRLAPAARALHRLPPVSRGSTPPSTSPGAPPSRRSSAAPRRRSLRHRGITTMTRRQRPARAGAPLSHDSLRTAR